MPLTDPRPAPATTVRGPSAHRAAAAVVVGLFALTTASCASDTETSATPTTSTTTTSTSATTYPLTLDNCGVEVTVDAAPASVVTIKSSTTEMLLALGLGDRIVGTAFPDGPVADWLADDAAANPAIVTPLSDKVPGQEAVLTLEPDLVYAGWESNLSADGAGERDSFDAFDVATYVAPAACKDEDYKPDPLTFDDVFAEISEVGEIFDVSTAASELVESQRADLDAVVPDDRGLSALWYSSGSDIPYVGAGIGAPQMIMDVVGLENVAEDIHDTWGPFSWEEAIAADPDVIILVDAPWNTADSKIGLLEGNPATANLTAVQEERYIVIPFPATEAGVRSVWAAENLSEQLSELTIPAS
ncbi:putative F420-0 ABC transporter substrate-binding protein [Sanguibacter antarcticus]|uniref:Iron complex transport system substrate-binding protein n=1 Tax=Sanguibacter antarcticus TaxID=372484 RepID=A0A2A9E5W4_9MICO|nr:putative F420-0 ABC transporter substrate-binding protein [Sanguibacter antarcticus]PFG33579.1 iron complex transport system substrate-binding protein [Sanguibacter antarcticus]